MTNNRTKTTSIRLTPTEIELVNTIAKKTERTSCGLIRHALICYLSERHPREYNAAVNQQKRLNDELGKQTKIHA